MVWGKLVKRSGRDIDMLGEVGDGKILENRISRIRTSCLLFFRGHFSPDI